MKLIREAAENSKIRVIKEYDEKVIFKAVLQTVNEINRNGRMYTRDVIDQGLSLLINEIKNRNFVGELDHPLTDDEARQSVVLYKEASHIILDYHWKGNELIATVETLSTQYGTELAKLIKKDRVNVGFSLRAFGELIPKGEYMQVVGPMTIITWDCVSNPSHSTARIQEITNESYKRVINEGTRIMNCNDGVCRFSNYLDLLIERNISKATSIFKQK